MIGRSSEGSFTTGAIIRSASASVPPVIREALERASPAAPRHTRRETRRATPSLASTAPYRESRIDRKSTRLNSSHGYISYAVFCLKKKKRHQSAYDIVEIKSSD